MQDFDTLPDVSVHRDTAVDAETLWAVLSDLPALAEWAPGIDGARVTSENASGVGAVRRVATAQFGEIEQHVTVWAPGETLAYVTAQSGPFVRTLTRYDLTTEADGACRVGLRLAFEVAPGAMSVAQAQAVLTKGLTATLQALDMRARSLSDAPERVAVAAKA